MTHKGVNSKSLSDTGFLLSPSPHHTPSTSYLPAQKEMEVYESHDLIVLVNMNCVSRDEQNIVHLFCFE